MEEFKEREEEFAAERRRRTYAVKKAFEKGKEQAEGERAMASDQATDELEQAYAQVAEKHQRRADWIERANTASKRQLSQRAEQKRSQTASQIQVKAVQNKEQRLLNLQAVTEQYEGLQGELEGERQALAGLTRRASGAMRGFLSYQALLKPVRGSLMEVGEIPQEGQTPQYLERAKAARVEAEKKLDLFKGESLARLFSFLPPWLLIVLGGGTGLYLSNFWETANWGLGGGVIGGTIALIAVIQVALSGGGRPSAEEVAKAIERTRRLQESCGERIAQRFSEELAQLSEDGEGDNRWAVADQAAADLRKRGGLKLEEKHQRVLVRNDAMREAILGPRRKACEAILEELQAKHDQRVAELKAVYDRELAEAEAELAAQQTAMEREWEARINPIYDESSKLDEFLQPLTPAWSRDYFEAWAPSGDIHNAARIGQLNLGGTALAEEKELGLEGARDFSIPLALHLPHEGSLLLETNGEGREQAVELLNNAMLRLLATTPPGKLSFTIIDPVGLGENFAGIMHLADFEDSVINGRIWTQRGQIEEKLAELNEHIEKVIQMYLRNEYETITEYNEEAGNIAEKYHFLVIADFPAGFSDTAASRLQSILMSGARCGIYTLIHWDHQATGGPQEFVPDTLRERSIRMQWKDGGFLLGPEGELALPAVLDRGPEPELAVEFIQKIGQSSIDSNRVEVPFAHVIPKEEEVWTSETTNELRVPIGRTGATKLQYLAIGKGTRQHALFAGKTGSGKSTLFHVIISNLALWCSPKEVEFYLVDFKKGVEFKCYAAKRLPHARVVAIESDREFGLSVLKRVDEELRQRGDMFRKLGVQDVAGYKRAGGTEPVPRSLLIIDEFQELFVEDDRIAQDASVLLDRIVRQGRAFGIHVLLGSQTLGGAYSMARTTMGQMVIRVALQCNEADAYLIMDDSNPAPRMLTRPGEGIYNDSAGAITGNSPFQVVWLPDDERDAALERVREIALEKQYRGPAPIVFEGNAPADVRENELLTQLLAHGGADQAASGKAWLGAPNSIKGPTEATFHRQSGNNLIVIGQREEAALAMIGVSLVSLAAQFPNDGARFIVCDGTAPGSSESAFLEAVTAAIPHGVELVKNHDVPRVMNELAEEQSRRASDEELATSAPPVFLFVHNVQKFKKLKHEDDFDFSFDSDDDAGSNPGAQMNELVTEGTSLGLHVIASVDTYNNVNRFFSRKSLSEFEMRVIFQMSQNDSAALVDSPAASNLGLHRALFYNEHEGYLETFRPYALPGSDWIEEVKGQLG